MSNPYPQLQLYPLSGLTFQWALAVDRPGHWPGTMSLGSEGVAVTEHMLVRWSDMIDSEINMLGQLLGWSERIGDGGSVLIPGGDEGDSPSVGGVLSRHLPFQHPTFPQLWCTRIAAVSGIQDQGLDETSVVPIVGNAKVAPTSTFNLARITLQFTRPNYAILRDNDPLITPDANGYPQEWNRYTDRFWEASVQMLSSEREQFIFAEGAPSGHGPGSNDGQKAGGAFGRRVARQKLKRTWYEIPEAGIYDSNGYPVNLFENQLIFIVVNAVAGSANPGDGGGNQIKLSVKGTIPGLCNYQRVTVQGIAGTTEANGYWVVNNVGGGGSSFELIGSKFTNAFNNTPPLTGTAVTDQISGSVNNQTFFGQPTGTLLYETAEIHPRPLQIPPALMSILTESVQLQYNVTIHVERFNPMTGAPDKNGVFPATQGHNTAPWAGDYQFYALRTPYRVGGKGGGFYPFGYAYLQSLFQIL